MAGPGDNDHNREHDSRKRWPSENENPFITFRRFADQQVNSIVKTFFALPSAFTLSSTERHRCLRRDEHRHSETDQLRGPEANDKHEDEVGPFDRMFRDVENAMAREEEELQRAWKDAENTWQNGGSLKDKYPEPKVWYWSWSWPPRDGQGSEQYREALKDEIMSRAEMWKQVRNRQEGHRSLFDSPRHQAAVNHDVYDKWEDYLLHDSYSPLQLERSDDLGTLQANWRRAYEDLLSETVKSVSRPGKWPLYYTDDRDCTTMSQQQWIEHLQSRHDSMWWGVPQRGSPLSRELERLSSEMPRAIQELEAQHSGDGTRKRVPWSSYEQRAPTDSSDQPSHRDTTNDTGAEPHSELDMYERFLDSSTPSESMATGSTPKPSIQSTLTTTERTVDADGTITTKVVLKKRFADGREESSETLHTSKGNKSQMKDLEGSILRASETSGTMQERENKERKGGWFWSS